MEVTLDHLRTIARAAQAKIRTLSKGDVHKMFVGTDYHGFTKARFPDVLLAEIVTPLGIDPKIIQLEVVYVTTDLKREVHLHHHTTTFAICLGSDEHFSDPKEASAYKVDHWTDFHAGDEIEIPPGTPHGFTVEGRGTLTFLLAQSPPMIKDDGHDDYLLAA